MRSHFLSLIIALFFSAFAQVEANDAVVSPPAPLAAKPTLDKNTRTILSDLKLADSALEEKLSAVLVAHFIALQAWHQQHDSELKALWSQFDQARAAKDSAGANEAIARIDTVYFTFRPQHDSLRASLDTLLTPAQIERIEDLLTVEKVKVTYSAYETIFPGLTSEQKAVVLQELKAARAEAIDAGSMVEKSAFFKKHKIRIEEVYFAAQGLDAQQFRREFAAKSKVAPTAKSTALPASVAPSVPRPPATEIPVLWYAQPAVKWEEALPVGSGRLGAMVFGGAVDERIQFNEDTLWTGKPHDYVRAGSGDALPEVRRLLADGKIKEAETLARAKVLSDPVRQKAYQPFGDLRLHFPGHEKSTDYRRELNLDTAVARTSYQVEGVTFTREVIASYPDDVIAVRLSASQSGALNFTLRLDSPHKNSATILQQSSVTGGAALHHDSVMILTGQVEADGLRFESRVRVIPRGGNIRADGSTLVIEQADSVTLLLVAATSFKTFEDISADPSERCAAYLARLGERDFATLLGRHTTDHQKLFRRVELELGRTGAAVLPTSERLRLVKAAGVIDADPSLAALEFQYGRYLLIASSRPGTQPANLQGIWNELLSPPWESKYTTNINAEMNYWPAEVANLSECHEPLFDLIGDLTVSGARTAQSLYHSRGWVVHHNTDLWRGTAPINNIDGIWPTGGAWLCWHLWEHWLFTGDRDFLARRAYPAMKSASLFFIDSLVRDSKTNWLVTTPSFSPEQGTLTAGPTMDIQLIRSLWQTTRDAARLLGTDADLVAELDKLLPQLPPNQIGQHGQLQEWIEDVDVPRNNHRHMSPLWALYPGADITPAEPKVYAGAKTLLEWRGGGSTGWSYAWRIPLWARVGDGNYAYGQLSLLLTKRTLPNLFDLCGPFQIDGNFGATAGIAEMLLQSHEVEEISKANALISNEETPTSGLRSPSINTKSTILHLLPALPGAWPSGSVTGLRARDGFEVDLAWKDGALTRATIHSLRGQPCQVRLGDKMVELKTEAGVTYSFDGQLQLVR